MTGKTKTQTQTQEVTEYRLLQEVLVRVEKSERKEIEQKEKETAEQKLKTSLQYL